MLRGGEIDPQLLGKVKTLAGLLADHRKSLLRSETHSNGHQCTIRKGGAYAVMERTYADFLYPFSSKTIIDDKGLATKAEYRHSDLLPLGENGRKAFAEDEKNSN